MTLFPELIDIIISFTSCIEKRLISKKYFMPMSECEFKLHDHINSLWYKDIWEPDESYWNLIITINTINYISRGYFDDEYFRGGMCPSILIKRIRVPNKRRTYEYYINETNSRHYDILHINNILLGAQKNGLLLNFS